MEATGIIKLKSLEPYRHLFPEATGIDHVIKKGANVSDTVHFMPKAAELSRWMVEAYVNQELKGLNTYDACRKLWYFVKEHIKYEKDEKSKEQIKSPRRLIADGGGDCDCMTNFVNSCMLEYGIKEPIINRITAYDGNDFFQHIYSLIPDNKNGYIIMDCVWNTFNQEKKFTNKEDYKMELQFLDGVSSTEGVEGTVNKYSNMDAQDVFGKNEDFGELGKLLRKKSSGGSGSGSGSSKGRLFKNRTTEQKQVAKEKRQKIVQKSKGAFNKINKVNPATALLRAGILASMKLNIMKVAEAIKWGYASRELAQSKGMDMSKYNRIKNVLEKAQNIFYLSGGNPNNLRSAILTGRGNRQREVSGFDGLSSTMTLSAMLGQLYRDELVYGMEDFEGFGSLEGGNGLGEPATGTAIAAASATMGALAALIKSIGTLFPNKDKAPKKAMFKKKTVQKETDERGGNSSNDNNSDSSESDTSSNSSESSEDNDTSEQEPQNENFESTNESVQEQNTNAENESTSLTTDSSDVPTEQNEPNEAPEESTSGLSGVGSNIKAFYITNKKWIKPTAITLGVGTVLYFIYKGLKEEDRPPNKNKLKEDKQELLNRSIEGVNRKKHRHKYKHGSKPNAVIKLM